MLASFKPCVSIFSREPSLNDARYGLRGVRVGEASNPEPQSRVRPRCGEEVAEDVLSSLEFDLTQLDSSDDEPLLRPVEGRTCGPEGRVHSSTDSGRLHYICRFSTDSGRFSTTSVDLA